MNPRLNIVFGILGPVSAISAAAAGRWSLASSAEGQAERPLLALPLSVRVPPMAGEVVSSARDGVGRGGGRASGCQLARPVPTQGRVFR